MQYALIRIVWVAPGTTRNESVAGLYRNDTPSPMCKGADRPRRVCTTNAFGGTMTVFHRHSPLIRTSTGPGGKRAPPPGPGGPPERGGGKEGGFPPPTPR